MQLSDPTAARVDAIIARAQAQGRTPSLVAAVVRDGQVVHLSRAGDTPAPDHDTQYRIGSISKTFTAALVLRLRDQGRLSLDDRLDDHLPNSGVGGVRLRQLLGHVAGLQREPDGLWWERNPGTTLEALVSRVNADKLAFPAYQRHHYSNLAYGLLGGVVEQLTGKRWWDSVYADLLVPLGMARTTYQAQEPFARGYVVHPMYATLREEPRHDAGAMAPAGQLWSTVADLAVWASLLAGSGSAVLAHATVAEMASPVALSDPDGWTSGAGLGLQLWRCGERIFIGHTGSMPGYLAVLVVHRRTGTGVVAFANAYSLPGWTIGGLGHLILQTVLDQEPKTTPAPWRASPAPPAKVAPLCGSWWWMGREYLARWDTEAAHLVITRNVAGGEEWRFIQEDTLRWRGLAGEQAGEILTVVGTDPVIALDIATFVFTRDPLPRE